MDYCERSKDVWRVGKQRELVGDKWILLGNGSKSTTIRNLDLIEENFSSLSFHMVITMSSRLEILPQRLCQKTMVANIVQVLSA
jgi:hypothetical protein